MPKERKDLTSFLNPVKLRTHPSKRLRRSAKTLNPLRGSAPPFYLSWKRQNKRRAVPLMAIIFSLGLALGYTVPSQLVAPPTLSQSIPLNHSQVFFPPVQACLPLLQNLIASAKKTIHMQAYSFTQPRIAAALIQAAERGVEVVVILDKSQRTAKSSQYRVLKEAAIPQFFDDKPAIAHNKVIIIDGTFVITGSYNFTQAAETKNAENLLVLHSPKLASAYEHNFQTRLKQSTPG